MSSVLWYYRCDMSCNSHHKALQRLTCGDDCCGVHSWCGDDCCGVHSWCGDDCCSVHSWWVHAAPQWCGRCALVCTECHAHHNDRAVVHGFAGYFEASLYSDIMIRHVCCDCTTPTPHSRRHTPHGIPRRAYHTRTLNLHTAGSCDRMTVVR